MENAFYQLLCRSRRNLWVFITVAIVSLIAIALLVKLFILDEGLMTMKEAALAVLSIFVSIALFISSYHFISNKISSREIDMYFIFPSIVLVSGFLFLCFVVTSRLSGSRDLITLCLFILMMLIIPLHAVFFIKSIKSIKTLDWIDVSFLSVLAIPLVIIIYYLVKNIGWFG